MPTANSASAMPGAIVGITLEGLRDPHSVYLTHFMHQRCRANIGRRLAGAVPSCLGRTGQRRRKLDHLLRLRRRTETFVDSSYCLLVGTVVAGFCASRV